MCRVALIYFTLVFELKLSKLDGPHGVDDYERYNQRALPQRIGRRRQIERYLCCRIAMAGNQA